MNSLSHKIPKKSCKKGSTVPYARSMGVHRKPITLGTARSTNRMVLKKMLCRVEHVAQLTKWKPLCEQITSYAQLSVKIAKLEKCNKKLKRMNKKRKHDYDSNSDDSDSS